MLLQADQVSIAVIAYRRPNVGRFQGSRAAHGKRNAGFIDDPQCAPCATLTGNLTTTPVRSSGRTLRVVRGTSASTGASSGLIAIWFNWKDSTSGTTSRPLASVRPTKRFS